MNEVDRVAVCSRSFSKNTHLRRELELRYKYVKFNETGRQFSGEELISFLDGCDKAITALETIDEHILSALPKLRVIAKYGVGLDMVNIEALRHYGVSLGWSGGVNKRSVSELTLCFAIALLRHVPKVNQEVLNGLWRQTVGRELSGKTVGIIGCGNVGKDLIKLLEPFQCSLLVHDIRDYPEFYERYKIKPVPLDYLLSEADIVTLHVPLDNSTSNILSADKLSMLRPSSVLINVARGGLVDEGFLKKMLMEEKILSAGFDVFMHEPPQDFDLLRLPNFLATPHIGGSSVEAVIAMGEAAIRGLDENTIP